MREEIEAVEHWGPNLIVRIMSAVGCAGSLAGNSVTTDNRLRSDTKLWRKLEELRLEFERDESFPNVLAMWEAIERIAARNKDLCDKGRPPHPIPVWINDYLTRSASKIARLSLGVRPDDDQPLSPSSNFDARSKVLLTQGRSNDDGNLSRDERTDHVASALGFVRREASAFQRYGHTESSDWYLRTHDDPQLEYDKVLQRDFRGRLMRNNVRNKGTKTK